MNLKQMAIFREVIRTGSVSEAARNLNRTQPSVSHAVSRLEEELGMRLFERRRGRLYPVPEAHYLFRECDEMLSRVNSVSQNMKRMRAMETGELRIVSMPGPAAVLLPSLICDHVGDFPDVKATLLSRSSDAVIQLVDSQQFDIGVADHDPTREIEAASIQTTTYEFNCVCALPADDPLTRRKSISPTDLAGRPLAALFPEHLSHKLTLRAFEAEEAAFNVRFIGQFFMPLLTYVQAGFAAAVIDPLTAEAWEDTALHQNSVTFRPFCPVVAFKVDILTPTYRPASLLTQAFSERLHDHFASRASGQDQAKV
ncbi:MAG: LysR substrate-binding domain-containing protein [Pseudomonadota bacterium]